MQDVITLEELAVLEQDVKQEEDAPVQNNIRHDTATPMQDEDAPVQSGIRRNTATPMPDDTIEAACDDEESTEKLLVYVSIPNRKDEIEALPPTALEQDVISQNTAAPVQDVITLEELAVLEQDVKQEEDAPVQSIIRHDIATPM